MQCRAPRLLQLHADMTEELKEFRFHAVEIPEYEDKLKQIKCKHGEVTELPAKWYASEWNMYYIFRIDRDLNTD